jgi:hypothetical protein
MLSWIYDLTYPSVSWELFMTAVGHYMVSSVIKPLTWCSVSTVIVSGVMVWLDLPRRYFSPKKTRNEYDDELQTKPPREK